ncbi:RusA family crossover junction endodeoxyribonuclease [Corynebacterium timonense]|uniref:Crossover junction endodeoxyribonuclease RusA n=1 Tax=Corynebacterium timonense TaxID=441500 RepID=A0A1H1LRS2_9CORY|nr:RusA family crossover junction endodeoxyribonuclease [Corynebacterium timonense]SDR77117.1 crossover junction endodeoxyribonuclease RusA [Corynebacterium timonense]
MTAPTTTPLLDCFIPGVPATQGSKRHVGNGRLVEMDKKLPTWRETIRLICRTKYKGEPIDAPVFVSVTFYLDRPKRPKFDRPATPGDLDKYMRALGDGLTGVVLKDDARIVHWDARKEYAPDSHMTGAHVTVKNAA